MAWFFGRGTRPGLFVPRSSTGASRYGPVKKVPPPPGTTTVWKVYASAQSGKIDLLALVTRNNANTTTAYWHTQVAAPK